jgi:hypothetical protein
MEFAKARSLQSATFNVQLQVHRLEHSTPLMVGKTPHNLLPTGLLNEEA